MEYLKVAGKALSKRRFQLFRGRNHKDESNNTVLDANIGKVNSTGGRKGSVFSCTEEDGVVRVKIVVKKGELKQLLEAMRGANNNAYDQSLSAPILSVKERLILLRKKHLSIANAVNENSRNFWSPALQSIPEEL
ncbi:VWFA domain-containing protein [Quillaja saponaria]|uniref:VWFA domain-containing protein n=1 Tax=Quillaja saponaria TaxID=32244 RepID=A0AAD7QC03_QUISA|nr:VWFA domain-containing protein [Quillaja saponaria]